MRPGAYASVVRGCKARRTRAGLRGRPARASSPAVPGCRCGVSWLAPTQHNGLFGKVAAVAALKLRLVQPPLRLRLRALSGLPNPRYVLRPAAPAKPAASSRAVAASRHCTGSVQALCAVRGAIPPPAHGPGALAPVARRRVRPVRPPGGSLLPGAGGAAGPAPEQRAGLRQVRALLAGASPAHTEQPARRCAPCSSKSLAWFPTSGRSTPSLLPGEGATAAPGPQGRCAPPHGGGLRPALTAWLR